MAQYEVRDIGAPAAPKTRPFSPVLLAGLLGLAGLAALAIVTGNQPKPARPLAAPIQPVAVSILELRAGDMLAGIGDSIGNTVSSVTESAALFERLWSDRPAPPEQPAHLTKTLAVGRGDTLMKLLVNAGVESSESAMAIEALGAKFDPRKLQLGQEITLKLERTDEDGFRLASLDLSDRVERTLSVTRSDAGFIAQEALRTFDKTHVRAGGIIDSSLYQSALDAGIPMPVLSEMIRLFSYDVDFQREVQPGDTFEVYYENYLDAAGKLAKTGLIRSAAMTLRGQEIRYFRYKPRGEDEDYFTQPGQSVRKALLRTPIDGARLTSGFGSRHHPVLGYTRMHRGVDFGAASGTPIQAAGDGVVELAGWNTGYGNYVRIRHNSTYSTAYAHMSRMAVKTGARVRQGQVIGYVGATGLATGPHLHYETLVNGAQVNPMSIRMPSGRKLEGAEYAAFLRSIDALQQEMAATPVRAWIAADGK